MELQHSEIVLSDANEHQEGSSQVVELNELHLAFVGGGNATVVFS
jgi:hypothetical protein